MHSRSDYVAYLAQILSGNTLLYSPYIYQKLRLYIKVKIVFEAHKDHTLMFFSTFFPYYFSL